MHIGKAILWARKYRQITRAAAAFSLQCDKSWIWRVEEGKHQPTWEFVDKMAKLCRMTIEEMRCGMLPIRLRKMPRSKKEKLRREVVAIGGTVDDIEYAEKGLKLPSDEIVQVMAEVFGMSVEDAMYANPWIELMEVA